MDESGGNSSGMFISCILPNTAGSVISVNREEWINNILKDLSLKTLCPNPSYWWSKEDVFGPELPNFHHVTLIGMTIGTRKSETNFVPVHLELGKGILVSYKQATQYRVFIPFEIQVCRKF